MAIDSNTLMAHYKKDDIREAILENAKDREIAMRFGESFGQRPDMLKYPQDILELAKQGATSFHASEELWKNPLQLHTNLKRHELDALRIGWDLVLDIDAHFLEYAKIAADLLVKALEHHGITSLSCKYSGNRGFHIGIPFEAFPEKVYGQETRLLFPDGPKRLALYLQEMIREHLSKAIIAYEDIDVIIKKTGKAFSDLVKSKRFDPFAIVGIDTLLISSRHLYRMPYCFNEKSGLVSIPIDPSRIMQFDPLLAKPKNVIVSKHVFLDKKKVIPHEAKKLIVDAFDFSMKEEKAKERKSFEIASAIPEQFFPPCMKLGLQGLTDGRKRFLFALINLLGSVGWEHKKIEEYVLAWNKKNPEPLRENYVVGQLRYHRQKKKVLPPNCLNRAYYTDIGICRPDNLCASIRNPASYAVKKARLAGAP